MGFDLQNHKHFCHKYLLNKSMFDFERLFLGDYSGSIYMLKLEVGENFRVVTTLKGHAGKRQFSNLETDLRM